MSHLFLKRRLAEISRSGSTLLWLEGAKHETVYGVKLSGNNLILKLADNVTRVITFERYTPTQVGLQFWSQNYPGVLYKWDQVPSSTGTIDPTSPGGGPDDEPPPGMAA